MEKSERAKIISRTGLIGIFTNVGLTIIKVVFGLLAFSLAMVIDSINNLTDALSSTVTVIGNKLAHKEPNKKHPFGYGRIEYIASFIVSGIILATAALTIYESINKIISPDETNYTIITIIMISITIVVKIVLGLYTRAKAKKTDSIALKGSGTDALFDALITTATLVGAIVSMLLSVKIEGYLGILISIFIAKTGVEMILETTNLLIGKRYDKDTSNMVIKTVEQFPEVLGVYDVYLNDYGPEKTIGSLHVEVSGSLDANQIDELTRKITMAVYVECNVIVTVGIYAVDDGNEESMKLREGIYETILGHEGVLQVHGYHLYKEKNLVSVDTVVSFDVKDKKALFAHLQNDLKEKYPEYSFMLVQDLDAIDLTKDN